LENSGEAQSELAIDIFKKIGMNIVYMDSHSHDRHAAFISHLPHAISYSIANSVLSQENPQSILTLAAGGFRDMSRLAKSSPDMWCDIFKQNRSFLLESMERFEKDFLTIKKFVEDENWDGVYTWMEKANLLHKIIK
jgi:prephenate dehydrogenase